MKRRFRATSRALVLAGTLAGFAQHCSTTSSPWGPQASGDDGGSSSTSSSGGSGGGDATASSSSGGSGSASGSSASGSSGGASGSSSSGSGADGSAGDDSAAAEAGPAADAGPPNCPAANPNDSQPDDAALQNCLNQGGTVVLAPGNPGYIIASGLTINVDDTVLTSSAAPTRARLVADPGLAAPLLAMTNRNGVRITFIEVDGNRPNRTGIATCHGYRIFGTNVALEGSTNFAFNDSRSTRAMCGSALQINGTSFELARNLIDDNGHGREAVDAPEPWSDGMTLGKCDGGYVHDNQVVDATDIAIVDGGGPNCRIENNVIKATTRHAFGGIALHVFTAEGNGDHTGTSVKGNQITAGTNLMSFGLSLGMHPWGGTNLMTTATGGTIMQNTVSGAVVDLQVDGVAGMTVTGNTLSSPSGTPGCGGSTALYTVAHDTGCTLDPGSTARIYDSCIP
jgi:hypothetical protein